MVMSLSMQMVRHRESLEMNLMDHIDASLLLQHLQFQEHIPSPHLAWEIFGEILQEALKLQIVLI